MPMKQMKKVNQLPALPVAARTDPQSEKSRRKLKAESFWATQIRRLFNFSLKPLRHLPAMPVRKTGGFLKRLLGRFKRERKQ